MGSLGLKEASSAYFADFRASSQVTAIISFSQRFASTHTLHMLFARHTAEANSSAHTLHTIFARRVHDTACLKNPIAKIAQVD
jgi:hypothetical protein